MTIEEAGRTFQTERWRKSCSAHRSWRMIGEWQPGRENSAKPRASTSTADTSKLGGTEYLSNYVYLRSSCHYSAYKGGRYRCGTVVGRKIDKIDYHYFGG
jgi:hypothetical protein